METGVSAVVEGARSAVGVIEAAVRLAVESAAVSWCAFLVADPLDGRWQVVHAGGSGAPAAGTLLSADDLLELDRRDPQNALFFRDGGEAPAGARRTGVVFARVPSPPTDEGSDAPPPEDRVHEALRGLFSQVHQLLAHLPGEKEEAPATTGPASALLPEPAIRARVVEEVARAKRYGGTLSILLIDVDETGTPEQEAAAHHEGNVVRQRVQEIIGESLASQVRQMDWSGRHGADAFLVVLPETGAEEALGAGSRFGQVVGHAIEEHAAALGTGEAPAFELRCGVSTFPVSAQSADDLLAQAEAALRATRQDPSGGWLRHAMTSMNKSDGRGFKCVCRRCNKVFEVDDRAHQRARRFCSHACYVADRRASEHTRDTAIREARAEGASLRLLAQRYGISAERVRQICQVVSAGTKREMATAPADAVATALA